MRNVFVLITFCAGSLCAADTKDDAIKAEMKKVQGTWQLVSVESEGKAPPEDVIKTIRIVIGDGKHTVHIGDQTAAKDVKFEIDPTKTPKETTDYLPDGNRIKGIYEVDGDTLKSCVAPPGKDRPTKFEGKGGNTLRVFKRVKD